MECPYIHNIIMYNDQLLKIGQLFFIGLQIHIVIRNIFFVKQLFKL